MPKIIVKCKYCGKDIEAYNTLKTTCFDCKIKQRKARRLRKKYEQDKEQSKEQSIISKETK